jgi:hypothetical protein
MTFNIDEIPAKQSVILREGHLASTSKCGRRLERGIRAEFLFFSFQRA